MQIASKCKPARAVRAKNKRHGKNLANIRSTTRACILKSLTVFFRSGLSHMKNVPAPLVLPSISSSHVYKPISRWS